MVKFIDVVKQKKQSCAKCHSVTYTLPCYIDKGLVSYLTSFGSPLYDVVSTKLLRIDTDDWFQIDGTLATKTIKFVIPKALEGKPEAILKQQVFEAALCSWMSKVLNIQITPTI